MFLFVFSIILHSCIFISTVSSLCLATYASCESSSLSLLILSGLNIASFCNFSILLFGQLHLSHSVFTVCLYQANRNLVFLSLSLLSDPLPLDSAFVISSSGILFLCCHFNLFLLVIFSNLIL